MGNHLEGQPYVIFLTETTVTETNTTPPLSASTSYPYKAIVSSVSIIFHSRYIC